MNGKNCQNASCREEVRLILEFEICHSINC